MDIAPGTSTIAWTDVLRDTTLQALIREGVRNNRNLRVAQAPPDVSAIYPDLEKLYIDLHQTPELSRQEVKTAAKLAERFRRPDSSGSTALR